MLALFSHCMLTFLCLQNTMENVCALSSDTLYNVFELAFSLLLLLCSKLFWICLTHGMGCKTFFISLMVMCLDLVIILEDWDPPM
jgi:hypothetical protein